MSRLRRSDPGAPGLRRLTGDHGEHVLVDERGRTVTDADTLARVEALVIPPAWHDVWISPHPNGHIQAVGIDDAGRKQYLYHQQWRLRRDAEKFDRVLTLAHTLPSARRVVGRDLASPGFTRRRALAAAFRLIDDSAVRIGSEQYLRSARTRGLTTLLCRHVEVDGTRVLLSFPGKGGLPWRSGIEDAPLARYLAEVLAVRGERSRLLSWRDTRWHNLDAAEVNEYLRARTGIETTAKDFRTLRGTLIAAETLALTEPAATERERRSAIGEAVRRTAEVLGNTPAVARNSYIDPRVFDRYRSGHVLQLRPRRAPEAALIDLLE